MKFANIVFDRDPRAIKFPGMYCNSTAPVVFDEGEGEWLLYSEGTYDFATYFNALSVQKLSRYCGATSFSVHFEIKGAAVSIRQVKGTSFSNEPEPVDAPIVTAAFSDDWQSVDFPLTVDDDAVIMGFQLVAAGPAYIRNGYYNVEVDHDLNEVELALATTTFKKETYILKNIELVRNEIVDSGEDIAGHFQMHVVDNGRTLDAEALNQDCIVIHPNDNAGGSGGFARGMIEAMEQEVPATHVLLMDDDVEVSPESIKRTYNLLRLANEEYKESFVSGAMLDYQLVEEQCEDIASFSDGYCRAVKPRLRVTSFPDLVFNEDSRPTGHQREKLYAAWWYCCIPVETIKKNGLPLPIFVRYDDVEYGIRSKPKHIMTMNGIGIWHLDFRARYNSAVERYQTIRNGFIAQATTGLSTDERVFGFMYDAFQIELKKFSYESAELILDGFEDYLKGPSFIMGKVAEDCFMEASRKKEKLKPLEELEEEADLKSIDFGGLTRQVINENQPRRLRERAVDFVSWNGHRFFHSAEGGRVEAISIHGGDYPSGKIRKVDTLLAVDWHSRQGVVRRRDTDRFHAIMRRYKADLRIYRANNERLKKEYSEVRAEMTSIAFWKEYLGI